MEVKERKEEMVENRLMGRLEGENSRAPLMEFTAGLCHLLAVGFVQLLNFSVVVSSSVKWKKFRD